MERSASDRSLLENPLSYFSLQPVPPQLVQQRPLCVLLYPWLGAYKRSLVTNQKEWPMKLGQLGFLLDI